MNCRYLCKLCGAESARGYRICSILRRSATGAGDILPEHSRGVTMTRAPDIPAAELAGVMPGDAAGTEPLGGLWS